MRAFSIVLMFWVLLTLAACGGGGSMGDTNPPPSTYTIGGTVTGLAGAGLVLQNNGGNNLTIKASGAFKFTEALTSGANYKVTVLTQPSTPYQNCAVTAGSGTASANITNIAVSCTTNTYSVGGSIAGLTGSGLVLQNNQGDNLKVSANQSSFIFPTAIKSEAGYSVSVLTQPSSPTQSCVVTHGTGTTTNANVTSVALACTTDSFTIGGTISGLAGSGLVLQNNSGDNLRIGANGSFTFATPVLSGRAYSVSVLTQPISPWQSCKLTSGGSGTAANANVVNVLVSCTTNAYFIKGIVTGLLGSGLLLQNNNGDDLAVNNITGTFSTGFTFATKINSGSNYNVTIATQPNSPAQTCWLGKAAGTNTGSVLGTDVLNVQIGCSALWVYESGPQITNQFGSYGTAGFYGPNNVPGARYSASSWTDTNGNYWLFGGLGFDAGNPAGAGNLNDLWEYSPSMGQWKWVGGSNLKDQKGIYSGIPYPGARDAAVTWTDSLGNFWLFGGFGYDSGTSQAGDLNDLWNYNPTTGVWTWVSGSNLVNQPGVYSGTQVPGARDSAVSWIDGSGNLWLFGGNGYDSTGTQGYLNDLWEFNTGTSTWTFIAGSQTEGVGGTYGTLKTSGVNNVPGARYSSVGWIDKSGNLWLFGGFGKDGDTPTNTAELNDLWQFNPGLGEWTWMGGSHIGAALSVYGTQGTPGALNFPGARQGPVCWTDANGDFWMFGGLGFATNRAPGEVNDLWKYSVKAEQWSWMGGATTTGGIGMYGAAGTPDPTAVPGARGGSSGWVDSSGNLWLFGGNGPASGVNGSFNDLWEFQP